MRTFEVKAHRDAEAKFWWAENDDVTGLVAEAAKSEAMLSELRQIVPELLLANEVLAPVSLFQVRMWVRFGA